MYESAEDIWSRDTLAGIHGTLSRKPRPVILTASYQPEPQTIGSLGLSQTLEIPIQFSPEIADTKPAVGKKQTPPKITKLVLPRKKAPRVYTVQVGRIQIAYARGEVGQAARQQRV